MSAERYAAPVRPPYHSQEDMARMHAEHLDRVRATREAVGEAYRRGRDILSTREVSWLLGLTERQLNHWVAQGYIPGLTPAGSGYALPWLPEHIDHARKIRDAVEALVSLTAPSMRKRWGQWVQAQVGDSDGRVR
jgi:hypothetical protein